MSSKVNNTQMQEFESFLSASCLYDYLRIIKTYKSATAEENFKMFELYKQGKIDIRDEIINKNMALVVSVAYKLGFSLSAEEKLEYIQCGMIGLMSAVDVYDPSKGSFSTCAEYWIKKEIYKYKYNNQSLIRRPVSFLENERKYIKFVSERKNSNTPMPPRSEICKALDITDDMLTMIENDYKLNVTSLDEPLKNDEDSSFVGDFIPYHDENYTKLIDSMVLKEMLETLVMTFSSYEYYILYYRFIMPEGKTLQEIGDYFGLSRESIRLTESKIILSMQKMFDNDTRTLKRKYIDRAKQESYGRGIKTTPILLEDYTLFFFLRDTLNESEQFILKQLLLSNLEVDANTISNFTSLNLEDAQDLLAKLKELINKTLNLPRYKLFSKTLINIYGKNLYNLDTDTKMDYYLDAKNIIAELWKDKDENDILQAAQSYGDASFLEIVNRFLGYAPIKENNYNPILLERDINYIIFGFQVHEVSLSELYPVFLKNLDKFNEIQKNYLLAYAFKKIPTDEASSSSLYKDQYLIDRLLMLSYKVEDYKNDNFSKEKYLSIRSKCADMIDEDGIMLLDLYYGVGSCRHTILAMANFLRRDYAEVEKDFRRSKYKAMSIYLGVNQENWDRNIYAKVLQDDDLKLLSPHLEIAKMFFIDRMSYDEILATFKDDDKMTQRKVSECMKYACLVMDFHRFGITKTVKRYSAELLSQVLEDSAYDEDFKETMRVFIKTQSTNDTVKMCHKSKEYVQNGAKKIRSLAYKKLIEDTDISKEEVQAAVLEHPSTNILSEREKTILSMYFGLENEYNLSGKRSYPIVIAEKLGIKNNIGTHVRKAIEHVKAHKIGFLKTPIDFIDRKELENILHDVHLPIGDDERNYLIDVYGLYDSKTLSFDEIAKKYGVREPFVRDRIYRAIVTIRKYQAKEIKGELYYPLDVEPYLKYFILEDREILKLLYLEKRPIAEIQERFGFSSHQMQLLLYKIRMHLDDLQRGIATGIDFDYFWSAAEEDDVPFYGNKELAIELCFLYYEKRVTQSDIIKFYHPELESKAVAALIRDFTAAVIKKKNGILKANDFSYEEVRDYYNRQKYLFTSVIDEIYQSYFDKIERKGPHAKYRPNKTITFDLIKEKYSNYFRLNEATVDNVRDILRDYSHLMTPQMIEALENSFGVTHLSLLSESDVDKLVDFVLSFLTKDFSLTRKNDTN